MKTKIIALAVLLGVSTTQVPLAQATELIGHVQGLNRHSVVAEVPGVVEMNNLEVGDAVNQQQILAQTTQLSIKAGQTLIQEGDKAETLFVKSIL